MNSTLKVGSRDSQLALWQAKTVQSILISSGGNCEIIRVKSIGDLDQESPLHELGTTGVFTKALDQALLNNKIDIAVHSLKDVPTIPEEGIVQAAVLKRDNFHDVLISKSRPDFLNDENSVARIATGSLRRKAQWMNKFKNHEISGIRGNVPTRIQKVYTEDIDATILSLAGVERLGLNPDFTTILDWMIPAPAQGVVGIFCRKSDEETFNVLKQVNDKDTAITSFIERQFLNTLEGGCTAPIGALAVINDQFIELTGSLLSNDGNKKIELKNACELNKYKTLGSELAKEILLKGGKEIMEEIRNNG